MKSPSEIFHDVMANIHGVYRSNFHRFYNVVKDQSKSGETAKEWKYIASRCAYANTMKYVEKELGKIPMVNYPEWKTYLSYCFKHLDNNEKEWSTECFNNHSAK